jgi:hypothetical protein
MDLVSSAGSFTPYSLKMPQLMFLFFSYKGYAATTYACQPQPNNCLINSALQHLPACPHKQTFVTTIPVRVRNWPDIRHPSFALTFYSICSFIATIADCFVFFKLMLTAFF